MSAEQEVEPGAARLLEELRRATGDAELQYASGPTAIAGGLSGAGIFAFELTSGDPRFAGPLVVRIGTGDEQDKLREIALMEAASELGACVPSVRFVGDLGEGAGGRFVITERLPGGTLWRWSSTLFGASVLAALLLWNVWVAVAGALLASAAVGIAMGQQWQRLHALSLLDVEAIYEKHGLTEADVDIATWFDRMDAHIAAEQLDSYREGLTWLRAHAPERARPSLCHGDLHAGNVMATWTRVVGVIDWENARVAEPELDIAGMRYVVTIAGSFLLPMYWCYLAYCRAVDHVDAERLRYYEALRTLYQLVHFTHVFIEAVRSDDATPMPAPVMKRVLHRHAARFRTLTGVAAAPPAL